MSDGELHDIVESLLRGQFGLLTTRRLAGDVDQLLDDDGGQHGGRQNVEDADRPHGDVGVEDVRQQAPIEQRTTTVTTTYTDHTHVLEVGDQSEGDEQERDEQTPSVGGDAAVDEETVMITTVNTATTQSTVSTVY